MAGSSEYWKKREKEAKAATLKDEAEYKARIEKIYNQTIESIERQVNDWYARYANDNNMTMAEARAKVRKLDMERYERLAAKYVATRDFSDEANEEMKIYNLTMRINRLELLKAQINLELLAGYDDIQNEMERDLIETAMKEDRRLAGILGDSVIGNQRYARVLVNASFQNATFSERLWGNNMPKLRARLETELRNGLIQGIPPRELARRFRSTFGGSIRDTERLMVTEMCRLQTDVQKESFERNGFTEYRFITTGDERVCPECEKLNGQHFKVSEMQPGENAPPMHPSCRCSTAAYMDSDKYKRWIDALERGEDARWKDFENDVGGKMSASKEEPHRWEKAIPKNVSKTDIEDLIKYGEKRGVRVAHIDSFDGDTELFKSMIEKLSELHAKFPTSKKKPIITITDFVDGKDYADTTRSGVIRINRLCLRDRRITEEIIRTDNIFQSSKVEDIVTHEYGHVLALRYGNKGIEITRKAYYNLYREEITADEALSYLNTHISNYATKYYGDYEGDYFSGRLSIKKYTEIIPEVLVKHVNSRNDFTEEFMRLLLNG